MTQIIAAIALLCQTSNHTTDLSFAMIRMQQKNCHTDLINCVRNKIDKKPNQHIDIPFEQCVLERRY